jgi:hypothetical protein
MLRDGRDGHGESHADADAYTNTHANTYTDACAGYARKHFDSTTSRYR